MTIVTHLDDISPQNIRLRRAELDDIDKMVSLLNRCYRHDEGWTNESQLIGGIRTTRDEMEKLIKADKSYVFVFEPEIGGVKQMLACIGVQFVSMYGKNVAYIGTFAVSPELQGRGVGNTLLMAVETFAGRHAKSHALDGFAMSILSHRPELFAYYQRRGYTLTQHAMPFPTDGNHGEPKREDLQLHWLFKAV